MTTQPNMAWRPLQISAWTDGPQPHSAKSGYSALQSFTASSKTELATLVLGLRRTRKVEASESSHLETLDTTEVDGANAEAELAARKRAAMVRRGAMLLQLKRSAMHGLSSTVFTPQEKKTKTPSPALRPALPLRNNSAGDRMVAWRCSSCLALIVSIQTANRTTLAFAYRFSLAPCIATRNFERNVSGNAKEAENDIPKMNAEMKPTSFDGQQLFGRFKITSKQIFHRAAYSFAMVNLRPIVPGHVLICSTRVAPLLSDLDDDEYDDLWRTVRTVQGSVEATLQL
ncbi:hypothetical protein ACHAW5_006182 [Stephanodiscus triporus]|uniref:HIT domain-containing protein n=1 Tax=Stephanodiscus triporus TaxID=2934178 RepID=A0ABD3MJ02_9STRA